MPGGEAGAGDAQRAHGAHQGRQRRAGAVGIVGRLVPPLLGDVEAPRVGEVGGEGVELAAVLGPRGFHAGGEGRDGGVAVGGVEIDGAGDDDRVGHGRLPSRISATRPHRGCHHGAHARPADAHRSHQGPPPPRPRHVRPGHGERGDRRGVHRPRRLRRRRRAPRAADDLRAGRRRPLPPRCRRQRHAAGVARRGGVRHHHAARRSGAGTLRVPPLDELPLGGAARHGHRGRGRGRQAPRLRHDRRARAHRPQPGGPTVQRVRAAQDPRAASAHRGGLGKGPLRRPHRRRRGHGPPGLGRRRPPPPRGRRPHPRRPADHRRPPRTGPDPVTPQRLWSITLAYRAFSTTDVGVRRVGPP